MAGTLARRGANGMLGPRVAPEEPATLAHVEIELIRNRLSGHEPERIRNPDHKRAAVAIVVREGVGSTAAAGTTEVLLIERAHNERDPWSGHMAFPGGRLEPDDGSSRIAASRETFEEVGVELRDAEYLGRMGDLVGNPRIKPQMVIAPHVFHLRGDPAFELARGEVQNAFWFPLRDLLDEGRHVEHVVSELPQVRFPGILVGEPGRHVVWGLTFRFLESFLEILGHPLPEPWGDLSHFLTAQNQAEVARKSERRG